MPTSKDGCADVSTYAATIRWRRDGAEGFAKGQYSRAHSWAFDGGAVVPASASPDNVPPGTANEAGVDPEEAFIAALSSCHMLFFLDFARRAGFAIRSYVDEAIGVMEKRADGRIAVTKVTLRPKIDWAGDAPDEAVLADLHHKSHEACFIANSVNTEVTVEP
jgi:organic hydroperoxide reductase OsmC/OhrA